jgi:hypothetical protein
VKKCALLCSVWIASSAALEDALHLATALERGAADCYAHAQHLCLSELLSRLAEHVMGHMIAESMIQRGAERQRRAIAMAVCEEIRQSVDVNIPIKVANGDWTQFVFYAMYDRPLGPDESAAEPEAGFVRLEVIDDQTTRLTVDLNYCSHYQGISDSEEIAKAQQHLRVTLDRYKTFVESTKGKRVQSAKA